MVKFLLLKKFDQAFFLKGRPGSWASAVTKHQLRGGVE